MKSVSLDLQPLSLGDRLAQLAQDAASVASDLGVWLSFDYVGPSLVEVQESTAFVAAASLLLTQSLHRVSPGTGGVFFTTYVWPEHMRNAHHVRVTVAHTAPIEAGTTERERRAAAIHLEAHADFKAPKEKLIPYLCDAPQVHAWEESLIGVGTVAQLDAVLQSRQMPLDDSDDLSSPQAWLIGSPPRLFDRMAMRLQRDGWIIRLLQTISEAKQLLVAGEHGSPSPALVIVTDEGGIPFAEYDAWARQLPEDTRCIWGHSTAVAPIALTDRLEPARLPLGPAAIAELREVARDWQTRNFSESASAPLDSNGHPRLLVVEDHPINQILAVEMLRALGYEADVAADGREAIEYCQRFRPSVVLMDLDMPIMGGLEATRRLLQLESNDPRPHVPIIALTTAIELQKKCLEGGMDGFVTKPIVLAKLREELARWV